MRIRSDLWVKAYLRAAASRGLMGAVVRHGDDEAGAIFIKVNRLDGSVLLFGPAPSGHGEGASERRWVALAAAAMPEAEADGLLECERRFDSDLWIVEIESRDGAHGLDGWLLATQ